MHTCAVSRVATGGLALPSRRSRVRPRAAVAVSTRSPHSRRVVTVRKATGDEDKGGSSEDGDVDWKGVVSDSFSEAKRQFMEPLNSPTDYVDMMDAPRKKEKRGEKYKEEYGALDPWSSNAFTTYGFIAVAVLLFVFVVVIGPPPDTNGRCTLPWC